VRQLRIPLQRDIRPRAGGQLADWAHAVRGSSQACLLVGIDGALIALSAGSRALLGRDARPGLPQSGWWQEVFTQSANPQSEHSLLARAAASGTPAHSVIQLVVEGRPAMVQVLVAPVDDAAGASEALLVFLRPVGESASAR
jgi:hypothetical protein